MKDTATRRLNCTGDRKEVKYKSLFAYYPNPQTAIQLSELMHDVDISNNSLIDMLIGYALQHVRLDEKTIYSVSFDE